MILIYTGIDAIDMEILQQLKKTALSIMDTDDEDFVFGRAIALTMKNLQPQQKSLAKIKIQQLVHEVEFPQSLPFIPHLKTIMVDIIMNSHYIHLQINNTKLNRC